MDLSAKLLFESVKLAWTIYLLGWSICSGLPWSICSGIGWSISTGEGGQFTPEYVVSLLRFFQANYGIEWGIRKLANMSDFPVKVYVAVVQFSEALLGIVLWWWVFGLILAPVPAKDWKPLYRCFVPIAIGNSLNKQSILSILTDVQHFVCWYQRTSKQLSIAIIKPAQKFSNIIFLNEKRNYICSPE